eukprot:3682721-Pyramimonas_sp.AAC.2
MLERVTFQSAHLEVDHDEEDEDGGQEVGHVRKVLSVERLLQRADLVSAANQQMEQSDDGTLQLSATAGVDGRGAERLPDDVLADVGGDEQGDAAAQTVSLLQQLVKADHDDAREEQLRKPKRILFSKDGPKQKVNRYPCPSVAGPPAHKP